MSYNWIFDKVNKNDIKLVYELGSRDCMDSIELSRYFNCPVIAFECNPDGIIECEKTLKNSNKDITLVKKAVHEMDGKINFKPFNREKYDNIGASSLFEMDFTSSRPPSDDDYGRACVQDDIEVECTRLDTYIKDTNKIPNLICMDIQEAELIALKGLGDYIKNVKYIVFEASSVSTYKGGCDFFQVHDYLVSKNFRHLSNNSSSGFPQRTQYFTFFDCIYINEN